MSRTLIMVFINWLLVFAGHQNASEPKAPPLWQESGFAASRLTFAQDGKTLVAVGLVKGGVGARIWESSSGKETARFDVTDDGPLTFPAISADGTAVSLAEADGTAIGVRNAKTGERKLSLDARMTRVWSMSFDPSGKILAVMDLRTSPTELRLFDLTSGKELPGIKARAYPGSPVFSPDSKLISIGKGVWDLGTKKQVVELERVPGNPMGNDLTFHPTARLVAAVGPSSERNSLTDVVGIWNLDDGTRVSTLDAKLDRIEALAYSPDGKTLAIAGRGKANVIQLWTTSKPERKLALESEGFRAAQNTVGSVRAIAFSSDGKFFAAAGSQTVVVWDVSSLIHAYRP